MWRILKDVLLFIVDMVNIILFYSAIGFAVWDAKVNSNPRGFIIMSIYIIITVLFNLGGFPKSLKWV